jgi:hypothetical protein
MGDGPIGELFQVIHDLRADDTRLCELGKELDELRRKLPEQLRHGPDALRLDDPSQLRELLMDIEPLLVARLISKEDEP